MELRYYVEVMSVYNENIIIYMKGKGVFLCWI